MTDTQRIVTETLNDLFERLRTSGYIGVGKCVERSVMALASREAARSAGVEEKQCGHCGSFKVYDFHKGVHCPKCYDRVANRAPPAPAETTANSVEQTHDGWCRKSDTCLNRERCDAEKKCLRADLTSALPDKITSRVITVCAVKGIIACRFWECQKLNRCRKLPETPGPSRPVSEPARDEDEARARPPNAGEGRDAHTTSVASSTAPLPDATQVPPMERRAAEWLKNHFRIYDVDEDDAEKLAHLLYDVWHEGQKSADPADAAQGKATDSHEQCPCGWLGWRSALNYDSRTWTLHCPKCCRTLHDLNPPEASGTAREAPSKASDTVSASPTPPHPEGRAGELRGGNVENLVRAALEWGGDGVGCVEVNRDYFLRVADALTRHSTGGDGG